MALSNIRAVFGVHSVTPYSRSTGIPYGTLKCLSGATFSLSGELIKLNGGSYKFPWAVEDGKLSGELSFKPSSYEPFLFELFLGKAPTEQTALAGSVATALTNKTGTSVFNANTGIASIALEASATADVKYGKYAIKATAAATVDVYALTDVDFARGTDLDFENDDLKITSAALTVTTGGASAYIPALGVNIIGGSGTIGMTPGDTAIFEINPASSRSYAVKIGTSTDVYPEFSCYLVSQKRADGEVFSVDIYRCKGIGLPINMEMDSFSEAEIKAECFYDASEDAVCQIRSLTPTSNV